MSFSEQYLKNRCSWDQQIWHANLSRWVLETDLFWGQKVRGQKHESRRHCRRGSSHSWVLAFSCFLCHYFGRRTILCRFSSWTLTTLLMRNLDCSY